METILILLVLGTLAIIGTPLFVILGAAALIFFSLSDNAVVVMAEEHYKLATNPHLITIPLFTLTGFLMAMSKAGVRLVRVSRAWFGWMPGGLAVVVIIACAFFTTFTGASGVTIVALGGLMYPMLLSERFPEKFSLGLITGSGSIGLLFFPSLPIILYGIVANTSIDDLFVAGILPGNLLLLVLIGYSVLVAVRKKVKRTRFELTEALQSVREAIWEMLVPVIVAVGFFGGFMTIAEVSAIAAVYMLIIEVFVHKDIKIIAREPGDVDLPKVIQESMVMVGAILLILGVALGLTNYLIQEEVPQQILEVISQYIENKYTFLILLTIFLLIVGCLMDIFSAIIVVVPLITPIAAQYNVDPVHLGIIFLANLELGYLTPPVGMNLFIASLTFEKPVVKLYRMVLPFLGLLFLAVLVITFYEPLSMSLVEVVRTWRAQP